MEMTIIKAMNTKTMIYDKIEEDDDDDPGSKQY